MALFFVGTSVASTVISSSTYHISDLGGGDCAVIGTWDASTKTCTLNTDITATGVTAFQIDSDGVTLDGNGHTVMGDKIANTTRGVYLSGRTGVSIKNMTVAYFYYGFYLSASNGNNVSDNTSIGNSYGFWLSDSNSNIVSHNHTWSNDYFGIFLSSADNNIVSDSYVADSNLGVYMEVCDSNTLSGQFFDPKQQQWYQPGLLEWQHAFRQHQL